MNNKSHVQSVILDKQYYTLSGAKKWVKDHGFINNYDVDEKPLTYRFRQYNPKLFNRMRTKKIQDGIKFIIGFN